MPTFRVIGLCPFISFNKILLNQKQKKPKPSMPGKLKEQKEKGKREIRL
jgi:hypothetical protein